MSFVFNSPLGRMFQRIKSLGKDSLRTYHRILSYTDDMKQMTAMCGELEDLKCQIQRLRSSFLWSDVSRQLDKENKVVFLSRGFFGDNIKYAFLAFSTLAKERGFKDYLYLVGTQEEVDMLARWGDHVKKWDRQDKSLTTFLLRARLVVQADHFTGEVYGDSLVPDLLFGAHVFQLWHGGIGQKHIALKQLGENGDNRARLLRDILRTETLLVRSASRIPYMKEAFQAKNVIVDGYPRLDVLKRQRTEFDTINVDHAVLNWIEESKAQGKKALFYAPTFRDSGNSWLKEENFEILAQIAERNKAIVVVNLHPYEQHCLENRLKSIMTSKANLRFVRARTDIYPLLQSMDALITDYSSIFADFLLVNRPIVFFRPDEEYFVRECRDLSEEKAFCAGPIARNLVELEKNLFENDHESLQYWEKQRALSNEILNDPSDGMASRRIAERIMEMVLRE